MNNSQTSEFNFPAGANLAPVKPFHDLKDPSKSDKNIADHYLVKQIKEKYDEKMAEGKTLRRSLIQIGEINGLFIRGEQVLELNYFTGLPQIVAAQKKDPQHVKCINKLQTFATEMTDKIRTSVSDKKVEPLSNSDQAEAQARKANSVVDYLELRFFTERFKQHRAMMMQIWGWYGQRVRPDYTAKSFAAFKEIVEDRPTPIGKGYGRCPGCGYKGEKASAATKNEDTARYLCPECDSPNFEYDAPVNILMPTVVGREKVFLPEIVCTELLFPSTVWDYSKTLAESDYAIVERRIGENALRRILSNVRFPEGESGNEFGLDAIERLAARGAAINGAARTGDKSNKAKEIVLTEFHLSGDDLYDIKIGGDEKTVEGAKLPKGKRLSDIYPDGCVFIGINGMNLVIGIYGENHKDIDSDGVFHLKAHSGTGRGIEDAVQIQNQFNRRYSQIDNFMAARATPATLFAENGIDPKYRKLLSNPKAQIPVKLQNFNDIRNVGDLIRPLQGESVPGDLLQVTFNNLENLLQRSYQITSFAGGNPRVDNKTYGGAQILEANSDALQSPRLALLAECDLNTVKNGFYQWVAVTPFARFIPFKSPTKTGFGAEISGEDVNAEYRWSYVEGSEAPKNRETEMRKRINFYSLFGGITGYLEAKQTAPKDVAEIEKEFGVNLETDATDVVGESCRLRFERAKQKMQESGAIDYNAILLSLEPSLEIAEPHLTDKAEWFQSILDTPEGCAMSREVRALVGAFVAAFKNLAKGQTIEIQRDAAEVQVAAAAPIKAQVAEQQQQAAQSADAQNTQLAAEALKVQNDNEQAATDRAHGQAQQDQSDAMKLAEMQHNQKMQLQNQAHERQMAAQNQQVNQ